MSENTGGRRPTLTIEPSIRVELSNRTEGDVRGMRVVTDDGTISAFMHWLMENEIYSFRGGASGPGFYVADFPAEYTDAINDYFKEQGLLAKTD